MKTLFTLKRVVFLSLLIIGTYLFLGYVLVPSPDKLQYYIPSIIDEIERAKPMKV